MNVSPTTIKNLKLGQESAFDEVYRAYSALIYYIIFRIVKNREDSRDIMQEAFMKMFQHINDLREDNNFHYWFLSIARNLSNNYYRSRKLTVEFNDEIVHSEKDNHSCNEEVMHSILEGLSDEEGHIVILKIVHQQTFRQIADDTKKDISHISNIYYLALKKLKKKMDR